MIRKLETYLKYGNIFCGIEHSSQNGQNIIYATILKKHKSELQIKSQFNATSIEKLSTKVSNHQHASIIINNENVLTKRLNNNKHEPLNLVYEAFPNINIDEFYYEIVSQDSNHFISICRKQHVAGLISEYANFNINITRISLGNLAIESLSNFINADYIYTSNSKISCYNQTIVTIEKTKNDSEEFYDINGIQSNSNYILSISGALNSVLNHFKPQHNLQPLIQSLHKNYVESRFFKEFLKFSGVFILSILLINFFVFNHYFERVNLLKEETQIHQTTKQNIQALQEDVGRLQKKADDMLKISSSRSSFYINKIVQKSPDFILLTELNYHPLEKRIKASQPIEINENTILISGESSNNESFPLWINELEKLEWIQKIEILNFSNVSSSQSEFSLKIYLKHEN
ncbi:hypothetical protein NO995_07395 [Aestuariibaculum sp. M13]|uniref:hypothetical protein n=1 Tax=Aestuariibaculum sp. M13 TaxID=2967132 RepID=UPI002159F278|nr:hypothetical protein [Aestuariibaculum sp. M13]MCR8667499.1 hypothetical protein [Aestuariibaculum sp. M13]